MHFCPTCANILQVCNGPEGFRFFCNSCPYVHAIKKPIAQRTYLKRKEVDDVLGGAEAWKNVDQTEGAWRTPGWEGMDWGGSGPMRRWRGRWRIGCTFCQARLCAVALAHSFRFGLCVCVCSSSSAALCPKCANVKAFFMQIQTRSADEPMTTFYKVRRLRTRRPPLGRHQR